MAAPNRVLRAVRVGMRMSQDDLARALREAGQRAGEPNDASKRLVQRWESGVTAVPRPVHARALESVTGLPIEALGFTLPAPDAADALDQDAPVVAEIPAATGTPRSHPIAHGSYAGVWLSRYEYFSSGRRDTFTGLHYVVALQHGHRLTVRSLPGSSDSTLTMDLLVESNVITGTWVEQTAHSSHYRGARYHGALQLLAEPTGRRMLGKWVGFGKEMDWTINTGPWELVFQDASTNKATVEKYNRRPTT